MEKGPARHDWFKFGLARHESRAGPCSKFEPVVLPGPTRCCGPCSCWPGTKTSRSSVGRHLIRFSRFPRRPPVSDSLLDSPGVGRRQPIHSSSPQARRPAPQARRPDSSGPAATRHAAISPAWRPDSSGPAATRHAAISLGVTPSGQRPRAHAQRPSSGPAATMPCMPAARQAPSGQSISPSAISGSPEAPAQRPSPDLPTATEIQT
ncbi:translation initiation factor IF-2 [Zea mays]|uniref:Uncharacterized protein n=1 Tax=Zea mays TaxID=4577 RepID=C0PDP6_MAIZE|nr:translation initiation factor IF-2 [Zea mays]ACN33312.1 unknown [Zea mays]|eukprot:XP_020408419.1 uncharacterized protein LOC109946091 [Zea mays]